MFFKALILRIRLYHRWILIQHGIEGTYNTQATERTASKAHLGICWSWSLLSTYGALRLTTIVTSVGDENCQILGPSTNDGKTLSVLLSLDIREGFDAPEHTVVYQETEKAPFYGGYIHTCPDGSSLSPSFCGRAYDRRRAASLRSRSVALFSMLTTTSVYHWTPSESGTTNILDTERYIIVRRIARQRRRHRCS